MTGVVDGISKIQNGRCIEINPEDAEGLKLLDGDIVRISSKRSSLEVRVKVSERVPKGVVFSTFHFSDLPVNSLISSKLDPISKVPGFKVCAVKIEKI